MKRLVGIFIAIVVGSLGLTAFGLWGFVFVGAALRAWL